MNTTGSRWFRMFVRFVTGATLIGVGVLGSALLSGRESGLGADVSRTVDGHGVSGEDGVDARSHEEDVSAAGEAEGDGHQEAGGALVELDPAALESIGLTTQVAKLGPVETTLRVPGTVRMHPDGVAILSTRIQGKIVSVTAAPGDRVERGQVLVRIQSLVPGNPPPTVDVTSPIAGVVARRDAIVGEAAQPDKELFRVIDPRNVVVEARVPERLIGRVRPRQTAQFRRLRDDQAWTGRVTFIGREADPVTRTYPVWIEVSGGASGPPRPGQFGRSEERRVGKGCRSRWSP